MSRITLMIESSHENSSLVGMTVNKLCSEHFSENAAWGIELSVIEAINNIIKHAYKGNSNGTITIIIEFKSEFISIDIQDQGQPPPKDLLKQVESNNVFDFNKSEPDCFPESGMGIALMNAYMSKVKFYSHNGINTINLVKKYEI